ncbi:DUF6173 family protein [Paenibacillus lautus]|uniref:DUF6173 family protein n=1 Tax=Paenibacillus lautus TaxID=1401 RepID=UPI003530BE4C
MSISSLLASDSQTITGIGHTGKQLIHFTGFLADSGTPVELLQLVSQLNFLLVSIFYMFRFLKPRRT